MQSSHDHSDRPLPDKADSVSLEQSATLSSRRDFLTTSATVLMAGAAVPTLSAADASPPSPPTAPPGTARPDPYALAARFNKFLRVTDVTDGLDAVGRADLTLMDPAIRPLWMGMRFWGPALTLRVVPTNRRMPVIDRRDALRRKRPPRQPV